MGIEFRDHPLLETPSFRQRLVDRTLRVILSGDLALIGLLGDMNGIELIGTWAQFADEPSPVVLAVPKNMAHQGFRFASFTASLEELDGILADSFGVGSLYPIQPETEPAGENSDHKQRKENATQTPSRGQHRDNLVAAGHRTEGEKEREEESDRKGKEDRGGKLGEIEIPNLPPSGVRLDEVVVVVTEIDDQPDGDEGTETDEEWLKKVAKDVAVEKLHAGGESMKRGAYGFAKRKRGNGLGDLV